MITASLFSALTNALGTETPTTDASKPSRSSRGARWFCATLVAAATLGVSSDAHAIASVDLLGTYIGAEETVGIQVQDDLLLEVIAWNQEGSQSMHDTCRLRTNGKLKCKSLGTLNLSTEVAGYFEFSPAQFGLGGFEIIEVTDPGPFGLGGCTIELNDYEDCNNACDADGFADTAALPEVVPVCKLQCTCYDDDGNFGGHIPGEDFDT